MDEKVLVLNAVIMKFVESMLLEAFDGIAVQLTPKQRDLTKTISVEAMNLLVRRSGNDSHVLLAASLGLTRAVLGSCVNHLIRAEQGGHNGDPI